MPQAILILPGSNLHRTNVELYKRHCRLDDSGRCATCGQQHPCRVRRYAITVILASGEEPQWYDGQLPPTQAPPVQAPNIATLVVAPPPPAFAGYPVGDNSRRSGIACETYER